MDPTCASQYGIFLSLRVDTRDSRGTIALLQSTPRASESNARYRTLEISEQIVDFLKARILYENAPAEDDRIETIRSGRRQFVKNASGLPFFDVLARLDLCATRN